MCICYISSIVQHLPEKYTQAAQPTKHGSGYQSGFGTFSINKQWLLSEIRISWGPKQNNARTPIKRNQPSTQEWIKKRGIQLTKRVLNPPFLRKSHFVNHEKVCRLLWVRKV